MVLPSLAIIIALATLATLAMTTISWLLPELLYQRHRGMIEPIAARYDVPSRLVGALIWQESRYRADSVGHSGEIGLMQVTVGAAGEWARHERIHSSLSPALLDPVTNLMAGTWYLSRALRYWSGHPEAPAIALAEYNAGRANARRWAEAADTKPDAFVRAITYPATRQYVREVLQRYRAPLQTRRPFRLRRTLAPPSPSVPANSAAITPTAFLRANTLNCC